MIKLLKKFILFSLSFILFWQAGAVVAQAAPRLYFVPSDGSHQVEDEFNVVVTVDTSGEDIMAVDALISFDQNKLKVNQVTRGDFFSSNAGFDYDIDNSNGKLTIYYFSQNTLSTESGSGDVATVSFEAIGEGTASTTFLCESGVDTDSALWDQQGNDLIDCAACGSGSYEIGTGGTTTATSTSTPTPTPEGTTTQAPTPTPSTLPETGIETPLLIAALGGGILLLLSWVLAL